jgi:hypothetical protein
MYTLLSYWKCRCILCIMYQFLVTWESREMGNKLIQTKIKVAPQLSVEIQNIHKFQWRPQKLNFTEYRSVVLGMKHVVALDTNSTCIYNREHNHAANAWPTKVRTACTKRHFWSINRYKGRLKVYCTSFFNHGNWLKQKWKWWHTQHLHQYSSKCAPIIMW